MLRVEVVQPLIVKYLKQFLCAVERTLFGREVIDTHAGATPPTNGALGQMHSGCGCGGSVTPASHRPGWHGVGWLAGCSREGSPAAAGVNEPGRSVGRSGRRQRSLLCQCARVAMRCKTGQNENCTWPTHTHTLIYKTSIYLGRCIACTTAQCAPTFSKVRKVHRTLRTPTNEEIRLQTILIFKKCNQSAILNSLTINIKQI